MTDHGAPGEQPADKVLVGRDGFLFLTNDTNRVLDQHMGRVRMRRRIVADYARVHEERSSILDRLGGSYYHIIVPNKETILADYLPPEYEMEKFGPTPARLYLAAQPQVGRFTRFIPDSLKFLPPDLVYRKDDTHWTSLGAFLYFAAVFSSIGELQHLVRHFISGFRTSDELYVGDLALKIPGSGPTRSTLLYPTRTGAQLVYANRMINRGRVRILRNEKAEDQRRILIYHDSFADRLFAILPSIFRSVAFIHAPYFSTPFVEALRPDIVLNIQIERFMIRAPSNDGDLDQFVKGYADRLGLSVDLQNMHQRFQEAFEKTS